MNAIEASKRRSGSRPDSKAGKAVVRGEASDKGILGFRRGIGAGMSAEGRHCNTGSLGGAGVGPATGRPRGTGRAA